MAPKDKHSPDQPRSREPAARPGPKGAPKTGAKPGPKFEAKFGAQYEPKSGPKSGPKSEPRSGAAPGAKPAPKPRAKPAAKPVAADPAQGERIAKVLSRRGIASRREAERLIEAGEVTVNGKVIDSPALNVTDADRITVSGQPLPEREEARLWLYYKPEGLVTSASDEKGRDTVFDHLPEDMPRVMSVGRLDLNSEGLLLLTNDGGLKRRLELPSTGWLRKYRVRVNGAADDVRLQPLRDGITIEGERFQPMQVTLDRVQGANAWVTVGLREGRNREIRRAMNAVGLYVNRLIRVSYGPFRLGDLEPGQVDEVKARVLREQLGEQLADPLPGADAEDTSPRRRLGRKPRGDGPAPAAVGRRTGPSSDSAPPRGKGAKAPLPAGEGLRRLSRAWSEATTPREEAAAGRKFTTRSSASRPFSDGPDAKGARPAPRPAAAEGAPRSTGKPTGKPAGKPGARPHAKADSWAEGKASPRAASGTGSRPMGKAGGSAGKGPANERANGPGAKPGPKPGPKRPPRSRG